MKIHEYGENHSDIAVLIHPSAVRWDYFEYVIPYLQERFHLIIPALPGYDETEDSSYTSVEKIAAELEEWLIVHGCRRIACAYGCSMGGSIVTRMLADGRLDIGSAVIDGGITPYQLPWIVTRMIALRDSGLMYIGKLGGIRLLEKAFDTDEYSEEDLKYAADVLKHMSTKTIWNTFESCNNYELPAPIRTECRHIEYWYAEKEEKSRKWDIRFMRKTFPEIVLKPFEDLGHGGLAVKQPEIFASEIVRACASSDFDNQ